MNLKVQNILNNIGQHVLPLLLLLETPFIKIFKKNKQQPSSKENILIIGANFFNKGAQAMIFTSINIIKEKYPNKNIYVLLDRDYKKVNDKLFKFKTLPWSNELRIRLTNLLNRYLFFYYREYSKLERKIKKILKKTQLIVDISGYRITSQMGQLWISSILDIMIAQKYNIDYYIFPQSIGPFDFSVFTKLIFFTLSKYYLKYPNIVFVREFDGLKYVLRLRKKDVIKSWDIVLTNKEYNLKNIYQEKKNINIIKIKSDSIGIIPNIRIIQRINEKEFYELYHILINKLIQNDKNVYLLSHSEEDLYICERLKKIFSENERVILLRQDFTILKLEKLITQFEFMVASRYHSIVTSYKLGTPAIVISWANKYQELMKEFDQLEYYFDIRNKFEKKEIEEKINFMIDNCFKEKEKIIRKMDYIHKTSKTPFMYI